MQLNLEDWLIQEVGTGTDSQTGIPGGPPTSQPTMGTLPAQDPNVANQTQQMGQQPKTQDTKPEDLSNDPATPDMPDDIGEDGPDFESWRKQFLVDSIKGNVEELKQSILKIRDRNLDPYQRKFVEDNLQIIFLREDSNIDKASKEIRKMLKEELDHNNPGTTTANHVTKVLKEQPLLNNVFIKLAGLRGLKGECHRQFIAALLGAVQVGSGAFNEDLIYNEKDCSVRISTRINARFGEIHLGEWTLKEDDPQRYLKTPELSRLEEGSPEEKDVLRRRVVMESIADTFQKRAFFINVVGTDGTIYLIGWDLATSLKNAYQEGKLVVRTKHDDAAKAMIDDEGNIVSFIDYKIMYIEDTGDIDEEGKPDKKEVEFIACKNEQLWLTAVLPIMKEASGAFDGMAFKEIPWTGQSSDLKTLSRCVPSMFNMLMQNC